MAGFDVTRTWLVTLVELLFRLDGVEEKGTSNVVAAWLVSVKSSPVHPLCGAALGGAVRAFRIARAPSWQTPLPLGRLEGAAKLDVLVEAAGVDLIRLDVTALDMLLLMLAQAERKSAGGRPMAAVRGALSRVCAKANARLVTTHRPLDEHGAGQATLNVLAKLPTLCSLLFEVLSLDAVQGSLRDEGLGVSGAVASMSKRQHSR